MIARVIGELVEASQGYVVVVAGGVGYQLNVSERTMAAMPRTGERVDLHARQVVRENEISLYGFLTSGERRLFDLLISASGLGPKSAISMLGAVGEEGIVAAILSNDPKTLTRAPGVGMKLAQRVCVDLVDKVREESLLGRVQSGRAALSDDVVEALVTLGHRRSDAERAAHAAREEAGDAAPQTLIPIALKHASGK
jgi:Holliday junction DNA helicase RuvA